MMASGISGFITRKACDKMRDMRPEDNQEDQNTQPAPAFQKQGRQGRIFHIVLAVLSALSLALGVLILIVVNSDADAFPALVSCTTETDFNIKAGMPPPSSWKKTCNADSLQAAWFVICMITTAISVIAMALQRFKGIFGYLIVALTGVIVLIGASGIAPFLYLLATIVLIIETVRQLKSLQPA
jgi:hypothetical protein